MRLSKELVAYESKKSKLFSKVSTYSKTIRNVLAFSKEMIERMETILNVGRKFATYMVLLCTFSTTLLS
jgi:hypothetical protein